MPLGYMLYNLSIYVSLNLRTRASIMPIIMTVFLPLVSFPIMDLAMPLLGLFQFLLLHPSFRFCFLIRVIRSLQWDFLDHKYG